MSHVPHLHRRSDDPVVADQPPTGVTFEQLEFFTEQTERAVRKSLRTYSRRAVVGFILLFAAFMANVLYINKIADDGRHAVIKSGNIVAVDGCNRDYRSAQAVRGVLIASKDFTQQAVRRGTIPPQEALERLNFYNTQLASLPVPDCRRSAKVLTDDPNVALLPPTPLWQDKHGRTQEGG